MSAQLALFEGIAPRLAGRKPAKSKAERKATGDAWRAANREKLNAYNRAWCAANREKVKAKAKAKRAKCAEKAKAYQRKYRTANPEKLKAKGRKYRTENAEKVKVYFRSHLAKQKAELDRLLGDKCACCGSKDRLHIDHVRPVRSRRTEAWSRLYAEVCRNPEVFQRLCHLCNRLKSDGPCCPCKLWDQADPAWREAKHVSNRKPRPYRRKVPAPTG